MSDLEYNYIRSLEARVDALEKRIEILEKQLLEITDSLNKLFGSILRKLDE